MWIIGVLLSLGASFLSCTGILTQKKSNSMSTKCRRTLVWFCGLVCMICGALGDLVAFGFATQSLLAPLGGSTIVFNALMAPCFVGEVVSVTDIFATGVILVGCTLTVMFGDHSEQNFTVNELFEYYHQPTVVAYFVAIAGVMACQLLAIQVLERPYHDYMNSVKGAANSGNTTHRQRMTAPSPIVDFRDAKGDSPKVTDISGYPPSQPYLSSPPSKPQPQSEWETPPSRAETISGDIYATPVATADEAKDGEEAELPWYQVRHKLIRMKNTRGVFIQAPLLSHVPPESPWTRHRPSPSISLDTSTTMSTPSTFRQPPSMGQASLENDIVNSIENSPSKQESPRRREGALQAPGQGAAKLSPEPARPGEKQEILLLDFIPHKYWPVHAFLYASLGGTVGAQSVLFGKTLAELLKSIGQKHVLYADLISYRFFVVLFCMVLTLLLQLRYLNIGLCHHTALLVVPIYQTFWVLVSIVAGGVYFKEFEAFGLLSGSVFSLGVLVALAGIHILTHCRKEKPKEEESEPPQPEQPDHELNIVTDAKDFAEASGRREQGVEAVPLAASPYNYQRPLVL